MRSVNYSILEKNDFQILQVTNLQSEYNNKELLHEVEKRMINNGATHVVVDLSKLSVFNSVALNFLLSARTKSSQMGGSLTITNPTQHFVKVLEITKLAPFFDLKSNLDEVITTNYASAAA